MIISPQNNDISKLPKYAPVILTWVPRTIGAMPPEEYIKILNEKKEMVAPRKIKLFINGPGFLEGQIDELKAKLPGIDIIDLHDPQYNKSWEKIDQGWKIDGKPFSIKEYLSNGMYEKNKYDRIFFAITIDTFRYIASCFLLEQQKEKGEEPGCIYADFDALRQTKSIAKDIPIPCEIRAVDDNNDMFILRNGNILKEIMENYKFRLISQRNMADAVGASVSELYTLPNIETLPYNFAQAEFIAKMRDIERDYEKKFDIFAEEAFYYSLYDNDGIVDRNYMQGNYPSDKSWKKGKAYPELFTAIKNGDIKSLKESLDKTENCNITDESGKYIAELIIENSEKEADALDSLELLRVQHGTFGRKVRGGIPFVLDYHLERALKIAFEKGYIKVAEFLIRNDLYILYKEKPEYLPEKETSGEYEKSAKGEISEYWDKYVNDAKKVADSVKNNDINGVRNGLMGGVNPNLYCGLKRDDIYNAKSVMEISILEKNIKMAQLIEESGARFPRHRIRNICDLPGGNEYIKSLIESGRMHVNAC